MGARANPGQRLRESLTARTHPRRIFVAMIDLLHLVRLLRGALASLGESMTQDDRDRVTRRLIADLQAHLEHAKPRG